MPATPKHNANGHRRRELRKRVLNEETNCALCGEPVDKTRGYLPGRHGPRCPGGTCRGCLPDPLRPEVDEDIPRSKGGSPYQRSNCHLMHRQCNQFKSDLTLEAARHKYHNTTPAKTVPKVAASPIW